MAIHAILCRRGGNEVGTNRVLTWRLMAFRGYVLSPAKRGSAGKSRWGHASARYRATAFGTEGRRPESCRARSPDRPRRAKYRRSGRGGGRPGPWAGTRVIVIRRQLAHSNLGITSVYLQGIDSSEIIEIVHA
jgi:hypothetical protein